MNRLTLPVIILLWSLLYSWFWNCERKPYCSYQGKHDGVRSDVLVPSFDEGIVDNSSQANDSEGMTEEETEELLFTPLDVYFETAQAGIDRSPEIDNFISRAKEYLAANPDKQLSIVGHTDNDGTHATNDPLSVKRANLVKDLLVADGFNASQLIVSGKGKREPIASNETAEGRAKNRRATVRLVE